MAIPVGSALGYALGGGISAHFGSWRFPFYLVAPPGLALGALCLFMRDPRKEQSKINCNGCGATARLSILITHAWMLYS